MYIYVCIYIYTHIHIYYSYNYSVEEAGIIPGNPSESGTRINPLALANGHGRYDMPERRLSSYVHRALPVTYNRASETVT
jgi:hypothetical protein